MPLATVSGLGLPAELGVVVLAVTSCALLWLLHRSLSSGGDSTPARVAIGLGVALMLAASFRADFINSDAYYYVAYGKAPSLSAAYTTPPHDYPVGFAALGNVLATPIVPHLVPSVYGPAWQALDRLVVAPAQTLGAALGAIRLENALALLVLVAGLALARVRFASVAIVALNPALFYAFVVSGHNDIVPLAVLALGVALLQRDGYAGAALCGAVAGAMKISLIVIALAALCTRGTARTRGLVALGIVAGAVLFSLPGGTAYVHAIALVAAQQRALEHSHVQHLVRLVVQGAGMLLAVIALALALGYRRLVAWAAFAFPAVSGLVHAWYFAWGIPYAAHAEDTLVPLAVALPAIVVLADPSLIDAFHVQFTSLILVAAMAAAAYGLITRRGLVAVK